MISEEQRGLTGGFQSKTKGMQGGGMVKEQNRGGGWGWVDDVYVKVLPAARVLYFL